MGPCSLVSLTPPRGEPHLAYGLHTCNLCFQHLDLYTCLLPELLAAQPTLFPE